MLKMYVIFIMQFSVNIFQKVLCNWTLPEQMDYLFYVMFAKCAHIIFRYINKM